MNTLGDVLNLYNTGRGILERSGLALYGEICKQFSDRIEELIARSFFDLCVDEKDKPTLTKDQLPTLNEMCKSLQQVDQATNLSKFAQAAYYCAVAVLLTMDGDDETIQLYQYFRADMLMNAGLLPS